jgi:hypothetical protein
VLFFGSFTIKISMFMTFDDLHVHTFASSCFPVVVVEWILFPLSANTQVIASTCHVGGVTGAHKLASVGMRELL